MRALILSAFALASMSVAAGESSVSCQNFVFLETGAVERICMPPEGEWNGSLVLYCHGYVDPQRPVAIPEEQVCLSAGCIDEVAVGSGFAFAMSSYRDNGIIALDGVDDTLDVLDHFIELHGQPERVYLLGFSQGALVAILASELFPERFDGAIVGCGPIGDFRRQLNYIGDFRVLFDALFPRLIPGDAVNVPDEIANNWPEFWAEAIRPELMKPKNWPKVYRLLGLGDVSLSPLQYRATLEESVRGLLRFNIVGSTDAAEKLGGQPFDNLDRNYGRGLGASAIDQAVERYEADPQTFAAAEEYETTGDLQIPIAVIQSFRDPQVPYFHLPAYQLKLIRAGAASMHTPISVASYGHCEFGQTEVLAALAIVIYRATGSLPIDEILAALSDEEQEKYLELIARYKDDHLKRME